jgi:hypothetical protein
MTRPSQTSAYRSARYASTPRVRVLAHAAAKRYSVKNAHKIKVRKRDNYLKRTHGIGYQQKVDLLAAQGGVCKLCRTPNPGKQGWALDHNHVTGLLRGVLCQKCNVGLGYFNDDAALIRVALNYLL